MWEVDSVIGKLRDRWHVKLKGICAYMLRYYDPDPHWLIEVRRMDESEYVWRPGCQLLIDAAGEIVPAADAYVQYEVRMYRLLPAWLLGRLLTGLRGLPVELVEEIDGYYRGRAWAVIGHGLQKIKALALTPSPLPVIITTAYSSESSLF